MRRLRADPMTIAPQADAPTTRPQMTDFVQRSFLRCFSLASHQNALDAVGMTKKVMALV